MTNRRVHFFRIRLAVCIQDFYLAANNDACLWAQQAHSQTDRKLQPGAFLRHPIRTAVSYEPGPKLTIREIENKLLKGPAGCSANLSISENKNDLKEQIFNQQIISCDEVIWSLFGFSAASINTIVMLFIFILNALYIYNYDNKEKKY